MVADGPPLPHPYVRPPVAANAPSWTPEELASRRTSDPPAFVVDLRNAAERAAVPFPSDRAIPLEQLVDRRGELPQGRPVVLVDQFGEFAPRAAAAVRSSAPELDVAALAGGLDAFAQQVDPTLGRYRTVDGPRVFQLPRPDTGCLAYLVADPSERRAILIDPGLEVAPYLARLKAAEWRLDAIVETHTHADHLAGHAELHRRTGAPIYVSARSAAAYPHRSLTAGEELRAGQVAVEVFETPGHTVDHLTLRVDDRIFTGDTLLLGSCGRTDLDGGDPHRLYRSLHEVVLALPDATEVLPAHYGPKHALPARYVSTIGLERATNEALRLPDEPAFITYMTEGWPPKPAAFDRIVAANLADAPGPG